MPYATFRISVVGTKDGKRTFCLLDRASQAGTWKSAGVTRTMHTYPTLSRAVIAAENMAYRQARSEGVPRRNVTFIRV